MTRFVVDLQYDVEEGTAVRSGLALVHRNWFTAVHVE